MSSGEADCRTASYGGTSLFHIARGLRAKLPGHAVHIVDGDPEALRARGRPAIVSVHRIHVVVVRFEGRDVIVHDPGRPEAERMTFDDYRARFGGFAVVVEP